MAEAAPSEEMTLVVKWRGQEQTVRMVGDATLGELKLRIYKVIGVLPKARGWRGIGGLVCEYLPGRWVPVAEWIGVRRGTPGGDRGGSALILRRECTIEEEIFVGQEDDPELLDDFDFEQNEATAIKDKDVYKQKLKRRASQYKIKLLNPCRKGKKLLVLDIDYTLFDHKSTAENPMELMRPYLHQFLTAAYSKYDIMIWSATSMKWVELKMEQLGVLSNPDYKITALMDHLAMITVQSENQSRKKTFDCKPLGVIWAQFPEYYNEKNTIMFDDLRRNFVMNPQNGLVIKPFRKAHWNRHDDHELVKLTHYLLSIGDLEDLSKLDHGKWESFVDESAKRRKHS
ncbi:unnamed protein product [Miscanthus lutarioriparius]|uniref:FCP1 homology domain-containing protein n=1 Tax=Miscanthus lutarioriparius TaxID=422564 RepID=A0A811P1Q5_9POAL|nr:unnamed protein product [Miscanthus lutarioriparius]